jgi:hypothetical protein
MKSTGKRARNHPHAASTRQTRAHRGDLKYDVALYALMHAAPWPAHGASWLGPREGARWIEEVGETTGISSVQAPLTGALSGVVISLQRHTLLALPV